MKTGRLNVVGPPLHWRLAMLDLLVSLQCGRRYGKPSELYGRFAEADAERRITQLLCSRNLGYGSCGANGAISVQIRGAVLRSGCANDQSAPNCGGFASSHLPFHPSTIARRAAFTCERYRFWISYASNSSETRLVQKLVRTSNLPVVFCI